MVTFAETPDPPKFGTTAAAAAAQLRGPTLEDEAKPPELGTAVLDAVLTAPPLEGATPEADEEPPPPEGEEVAEDENGPDDNADAAVVEDAAALTLDVPGVDVEDTCELAAALLAAPEEDELLSSPAFLPVHERRTERITTVTLC